ncbi:MAG: VOC family protein [Betaproteobacteria bacterium]|nr:VOC family protein [Betaproteobacteria bacterium]
MNAHSPMESGPTAIPRATSTRGIHHLAFTTEDMKLTTEFLTRVVGMPLIHAMRVPPGVGTGPGNRGNPPYEELRHYFFDMGNDSLLAYFEIPAGAEPKAKRDAIGGMQHCAFAITPAKQQELIERLKANGIPFDGPMEILPGLFSIYFYDPNGIRMEACAQPAAGDLPTVINSVLQTKSEASLELSTLPGADLKWLAEATAILPESRAR